MIRVVSTLTNLYGRSMSIVKSMQISGAKFERHCFNIPRDILYSVFPVISVSPGDWRKSPASRPWRAGYSDPNKKYILK